MSCCRCSWSGGSTALVCLPATKEVLTVNSPAAADTDAAYIQTLRERLAWLRDDVAMRREGGQSGIAVSEWFSDQIDALVADVIHRRAAAWPDSAQSITVLATGGNGRRRPASYSDVDLLIVLNNAGEASQIASAFIRDLWDVGFQVGHSTRTATEVTSFAGEDVQFATSLLEMRFLFGDEGVARTLQKQLRGKLFTDRAEELIRRCLAVRREEWNVRGNSVNQLEPDVKSSPGGLRDLHLLRWIAILRHRDPLLKGLVDAGDLNRGEMIALQRADEYLTSLRLDLHTATGLKQDVLTRELQLQIARQRGVQQTDAMRPVEVFMHEYFSHTSRVAEVTRRVTHFGRQTNLIKRLRDAILPKKSAQGHVIRNGLLYVSDEQCEVLRKSPIAVMDLFVAAATNQVELSPGLKKALGLIARELPPEPARAVSKRFREFLRQTDGLPHTLRAMYETGILEWLIPQFSGIRCLMQFNQYHSFTVDEHTFKAIDCLVAFQHDESPVGSAYQSLRHRATLHLAILMHDIGKGREGDHSEIGAMICHDVALRLQMAENKKQMLVFLVLHHLDMPNLAFRRDVTDSAILVDFARTVGSPELLRMLYVLTVADIQAVGPDVWSDWKGGLLADLYDRSMQILSGRPFNHLEQARLQLIREAVRTSIAPVGTTAVATEKPDWVEAQLDALPPFYLMTEQPDRIARDMQLIQRLGDAEVQIEGTQDSETGTITFRVFASEQFEAGSFHKIAGILSGLRMNILLAQVCTTATGVAVSSFRVTDNDFSGEVPQGRIDDVACAIRDVLMSRRTVESVFRRSGLMRLNKKNPAIITAPPHVTFDNDCSEHFTVIDVFATDRFGLLYVLAHTLHDHGLSVQLARIATHIDQVVDVFYVMDQEHRKLRDAAQIERLRAALLDGIQLLDG
jgi:[protein-PII] uridylyltransferase